MPKGKKKKDKRSVEQVVAETFAPEEVNGMLLAQAEMDLQVDRPEPFRLVCKYASDPDEELDCITFRHVVRCFDAGKELTDCQRRIAIFDWFATDAGFEKIKNSKAVSARKYAKLLKRYRTRQGAEDAALKLVASAEFKDAKRMQKKKKAV